MERNRRQDAAVGADAHAAFYGALRAGVLSRQLAMGRHFRANHLSLRNHLDAGGKGADAVLKQDAPTQEKTRWNVAWHERENPLMFGGQLLTCLAVEHTLGREDALKIIRSMIQTQGALYRFEGEFEGYIIRWDPVTSDNWVMRDEGGQQVPLFCTDFPIDENGRYLYCISPADPRWVPLKTEAERQKLSEAERREYDDAHFTFIDAYRRWEVSMDELVGLVLGYHMLHLLVPDALVQGELVRQAGKLGRYLAANGYLLVRPTGGFTAQGASGMLPALEFPFGRVFTRITGAAYESKVDFKGALERAGVWRSLTAAMERSLLGRITLGLSGGSPSGPSLAAAILAHGECFDVWNDDQAREFATAALFKPIERKERFQQWLSFGNVGHGWATGFPPFVGLYGLDDPDPTIRDGYLEYFRLRQLLHGAGSLSPCFATAVAMLLQEDGSYEAELVARLEEARKELQGPYQGNVPVLDYFDAADPVESPLTLVLDYMAGLSLAWLHAKRRARKGRPVTTPGFPALPDPAAWPDPCVPAPIMQAVLQGNWPVVPRSAIQGTATPRLRPDGSAELFPGDEPPHKPDVPAPIVPDPPPPAVPEVVTRTVREGDGDVDTGLVLQCGDELEIEASGALHPSTSPGASCGPEGEGGIAWDPRFPLHGGRDPVRAHPYGLLGRLGGYFFVGSKYARQRYLCLPDHPTRLRLRINAAAPGEGEGAFEVTVRVWRRPATGALAGGPRVEIRRGSPRTDR